MEFPASERLLDELVEEAQKIGNAISKRLTEHVAIAPAGIERVLVLATMRQLDRDAKRLAEIRLVSGINNYAQGKFNDQTLDYGTVSLAVENAFISLRDWIFANFPTNPGDGGWSVYTYDVAGVETRLRFTPAETPPFIMRANAVIATIG